MENARACGHYKVECFDRDGNLKWVAADDNLVVSEGLKAMNEAFFTGVGYTAQFYLGLYGPGATNDPAAGDTMASHPGWVESLIYSEPSRPAAVFGTSTLATPSVISNAGAPAVFNINAPGVIGGTFLTTDQTKNGTTGQLFSAVDFSGVGDRSVDIGDIVNVTYTFSLAAA